MNRKDTIGMVGFWNDNKKEAIVSGNKNGKDYALMNFSLAIKNNKGEGVNFISCITFDKELMPLINLGDVIKLTFYGHNKSSYMKNGVKMVTQKLVVEDIEVIESYEGDSLGVNTDELLKELNQPDYIEPTPDTSQPEKFEWEE